jgi:hypothetical protein
MPKLIIEVPTLKQAETLARWYEGQGEQDASVWFDIHEVETPLADVGRKGGYMKTKGDTVTLYCK